ncbi:MAG TPA: PP2C family protein-serine/threonine phosphatase [Terracidiphilus sp.]|nr:PP2C family protein-serine/threonine phosphatase [Terracidiphilus sp.]
MKRTIFILLLSIAACGSLAAQSLVSVSTQQCVWRAGDNPAWAAPNLNKTGWQSSAQWKLPLAEPHLWARCRADLGSLLGTAHPAIQISLAGAYQLFVNGVRIGGAGNIRTGFYSMDTIRQYPLPAAALQSQPNTIAVRITSRQSIWTTSPLEIHAGDAEALTGQRASFVLAQSERVLIVAFWYPLIGVVGLMLLGLFYYDRDRRELIYLSIICVNRAALGILAYCVSAQMSFPWALSTAIHVAVEVTDPVVAVLFFFALARRRVPRLIWLAAAVASAQSAQSGFTLLLPADQSLWLPGKVLDGIAILVLFSIAWIVTSVSPFIAFWPYRQISRRMRLLAALCMSYGAFLMVWNAMDMTADPRLGLPNLFAYWQRGFLETYAFVTACVLAALLGLLFRDQRRVTEERALLAGEMQAASEIQRMLAPAVIDTAPGLKIDVAFHPMRDVGGDFYLCRVLPDGRQRVLVGDVSGKGAAAAMTAALLLGGAERRDADSPGKLLAHLNGVLHESCVPGFATCLCADFAPDGTVMVANAGHLAPYCRGEEIAVAPDLPLGMKDEGDGAYEEARYVLAPGAALTFLSDGVVEARDAHGELLGFDRMSALTSQPAAAIADAAQRWGQEDDITVLTVARAATLKEVTA